jgi:hypothetical protein
MGQDARILLRVKLFDYQVMFPFFCNYIKFRIGLSSSNLPANIAPLRQMLGDLACGKHKILAL